MSDFIERVFESALWNSRFMVILSVIFALFGATALFIVASADVWHSLNSKIKVIGVVASGAPAMYNSYKSGILQDSTSVKTIADGIAVRDTNKTTYEIIKKKP
jgi:threonine dehydratase